MPAPILLNPLTPVFNKIIEIKITNRSPLEGKKTDSTADSDQKGHILDLFGLLFFQKKCIFALLLNKRRRTLSTWVGGKEIKPSINKKMPVKIRLTRHGKKHHAYYHIVVADSRAPRDGKFIEVIGNYDPNTNPATINLDTDKALSWVLNGAQPTDTCRAILSYKGVMFKNHLQKGVAKGVLTQEQADAKFQAWLDEKAAKIENKRIQVKDSFAKISQNRLADEATKKEAKMDSIRKKNTPPPVEETPAEAEAPVADGEVSAEGEAPAEA